MKKMILILIAVSFFFAGDCFARSRTFGGSSKWTNSGTTTITPKNDKSILIGTSTGACTKDNCIEGDMQITGDSLLNTVTVDGRIEFNGPIESSISAYQSQLPLLWTDFMVARTTDTSWPYYATAIQSGSISPSSGNADHPGTLKLASSVNANSGCRVTTELTAFQLYGNEEYICCFQLSNLSDDTITIRLGFGDSSSHSDNTDGVYFEISGTTGEVCGKTANSSTRSISGTTYTATVDTWYSAHITLNDDASEATFTLRDDNKTVLWTDSLSTNIPTTTTRLVGSGAWATFDGTAIKELLRLDYMGTAIKRTLTR